MPLQLDVPTIRYIDLTEMTTIAAGGFGVVYRAKHPDWGTVAYKQLTALFISPGSQFVYYFFIVVCSLRTICVHSCMLHGSETWPVKKKNELTLQ